MLGFGKKKLQVKSEEASQAVVKKLQTWILPTERPSTEQLLESRAYIDAAKLNVGDLSQQLGKLLVYMAMIAISLYALSISAWFLAPIVEEAWKYAVLLSIAVVGANVVFLAPSFVRLKLEEDLKLLEPKSTVVVEDMTENEQPEVTLDLDLPPNIAKVTLDADTNLNQSLDEDHRQTSQESLVMVTNDSEEPPATTSPVIQGDSNSEEEEDDYDNENKSTSSISSTISRPKIGGA